jgi:glucose/arabinose dehydrogenase
VSPRASAALVLASALLTPSAAAPAATMPGLEAGAGVPQSGTEADEIRADLRAIRLPPGFSIELYALVPHARHLAVAPGTDTVIVGTRTDTVWAVTRASPGVPPQVRAFAPQERFADPNGVCFAADGSLVVTERNRVTRLRAASWADPARVEASDVVPAGALVPVGEDGPGHGARVCRVGPDGAVYVAIGEPSNVPPRDKLAHYREVGIGGIVRFAADGSRREVFATGIRNSVGMDFDPRDHVLWFTDNQTDNMGDDTPPGELNRAPRAGEDFGYPYWDGHVKVAGTSVARELADLPEPRGAVFPVAEFPAHQAQLGMTFYAGSMFPARYRGGIFVASHGSWNRSVPTGALIDFVPVAGEAHAGPVEVFAEGWRRADGSYRGRPVDVAPMRDGSLLVSDDARGALYRISYAAP